MLKRLNARHRDIIRRLVCGETKPEIALELNISESYLRALVGDPLFKNELDFRMDKADEQFFKNRADTMDIIHAASPAAAMLKKEVVEKGTMFSEVDGATMRTPSASEILSTATDILDRCGHRKPTKALVGHINLGELIISAYESRRAKEDGAPQPQPLSQDADEDVLDVDASEVLGMTD